MENVLGIILVTMIAFGLFWLVTTPSDHDPKLTLTISQVIPSDGAIEGSTFKKEGLFQIEFSTTYGILPMGDRLLFTLKNLSDQMIKVIWDECSFVDSDGVNRKIFHSNVRYIERDSHLPPSLIAPQTILKEIFQPIDAVGYSERMGWYLTGVFPTKKGTEFGAVLTLEIGQDRISYYFKFRYE